MMQGWCRYLCCKPASGRVWELLLGADQVSFYQPPISSSSAPFGGAEIIFTIWNEIIIITITYKSIMGPCSPDGLIQRDSLFAHPVTQSLTHWVRPSLSFNQQLHKGLKVCKCISRGWHWFDLTGRLADTSMWQCQNQGYWAVFTQPGVDHFGRECLLILWECVASKSVER